MRRQRNSTLEVIKQGHESEIHMQLLMTVEQRQAGVIRRKIYFDLLIAADHDDVLEHTCSRDSCKLSEFETVTM